MQQAVFGGQRLLDLHDDVGLVERRGVVAHHGRAGLRVIRIGIARAGPGIALDQHLMAALDELISCRGQQATRYSWSLISLGTPMIIGNGVLEYWSIGVLE